jgi:hypothetical protein
VPRTRYHGTLRSQKGREHRAPPAFHPDLERDAAFTFEWTNPRLGKVIKEVRLKGTTGFRGADPGFTNDYEPIIPRNGVILKAISIVQKRG